MIYPYPPDLLRESCLRVVERLAEQRGESAPLLAGRQKRFTKRGGERAGVSASGRTAAGKRRAHRRGWAVYITGLVCRPANRVEKYVQGSFVCANHPSPSFSVDYQNRP